MRVFFLQFIKKFVIISAFASLNILHTCEDSIADSFLLFL